MITEKYEVPNCRTIADLIHLYQTDPISTYLTMRYQTRKNHEGVLRRLAASLGDIELSSIHARDIKRWHKEWSADGKVAMSHTFVAKLRALTGFGSMLEIPEAARLYAFLHKMKFPQSAPRVSFMTAEQAIAVREKARAIGYYSMALAQAFQFELMLRQKDVIGEWVPLNEPGDSDVTSRDGEMKWLRGIRWSEIDSDLILRHITSKKQKMLVVDLKLAPMVLEELEHTKKFFGHIPSTGPVIILESTTRPWEAVNFRQRWRRLADICGIPKEIKNMDSRAGGVTEASQAGVDLEHIRHAATHSDIQMTQRYSRDAEQKIAQVMQQRVAFRGGGKPE
jgi:integrase